MLAQVCLAPDSLLRIMKMITKTVTLTLFFLCNSQEEIYFLLTPRAQFSVYL